jgi:membrane fusion protein, copper/silver efflux system
MKHSTATKRAYLKIVSGLLAGLILCVFSGCDKWMRSPVDPNISSEIETSYFVRPSVKATLVHDADGRELMEISDLQSQEGSIDTVREAPLPGVLEATGQVTFDDKLVSTIISRLTGRIEEMRSSQWQMVHAGELVMKVFSPDYMSAEAEYLAASPSNNQSDGSGSQSGAFDAPTSFDVAANLREAAVRKLDLLGFTKTDISRIRSASPTVWIRAPITGIIVSNNAMRGLAVNPGDQLFALATLQRVWITADIYQDDLSRVWVGQPLEAVTASYPGQTFKGTVQRISPALDPNIHTLQLRCQVDNPQQLLKPQMLARVRLATNPGTALVIPQSALVYDDTAYYAFIVAGPDRLERRQVAIAEWNQDGYARVVNGIKPGEKFLAGETPLRFNAMWHAARVNSP